MRKESGITLSILVVTIIILIILAGITISGITSYNGLFESMENLTSKHEEKAQNERDDIRYLENSL